MDWFSVHLQARARAGEPHAAPGEAAAAKLMDLLEEHDGIVAAGDDSWDATIGIYTLEAGDAAGDGALLIQAKALEAGMPDWPAVSVEAIREDVLDEQLSAGDPDKQETTG